MIVLLVVRPGPLRDGLNALLSSMPEVQLVAQANDASAAIDFCQERPNELVIMEIKPGDRGLLTKVLDIKVLCPKGEVIALIHDEEDWEPAEAAGVDLIIRVGIRAVELRERIAEAVVSLEKAAG